MSLICVIFDKVKRLHFTYCEQFNEFDHRFPSLSFEPLGKGGTDYFLYNSPFLQYL